MAQGRVTGGVGSEGDLQRSGPVLLEPLLVHKVWGGDRLQALADHDRAADARIGEAWLVYDRPEGSSVIGNADDSLADLREARAADLMGGAAPGYGGRFPLLVKYLHARELLSLQVHPDDAHAVGDGGKEECWLVLRAEESAMAYLGLKPGVSTEDLVTAVDGGDAEELRGLLNVFSLQVGDVVHVPPGTVHALGGDALVLEVQQNSDLTFRLSDWGRGRLTHVAGAVACLDAGSRPRLNQEVVDVGGGGQRLVRTPSFSIYRYRIDQPVEVSADGGYCVLVCLEGEGAVLAEGQTRPLSQKAVLVPAAAGAFGVRPAGPMDLILCAPDAVTVTADQRG